MNNLQDMSAVSIKETRHLVFGLPTVLDAVLQSDRRAHGPLSRGEIVQAELVHGTRGRDGMDVAVRGHDDRVIEWRHYGVTELAAALINYCRAKRIPLPYAGEKSLAITSQGASFSIQNTVNVDPRAKVEADLSGRPLRYAKGYEPHALTPSSSGNLEI
jgi:hypothetical protein